LSFAIVFTETEAINGGLNQGLSVVSVSRWSQAALMNVDSLSGET